MGFAERAVADSRSATAREGARPGGARSSDIGQGRFADNVSAMPHAIRSPTRRGSPAPGSFWMRRRETSSCLTLFLQKRIAKAVGIKPGVAFAAWHWLIRYAGRAPDRGTIEGFPADELMRFCDWRLPSKVALFIVAMRAEGALEGDRFANWSEIQPGGADPSAPERNQRYRDRRRSAPPRNATPEEGDIDIGPYAAPGAGPYSEIWRLGERSVEDYCLKSLGEGWRSRMNLEGFFDLEWPRVVEDECRSILKKECVRLVGGLPSPEADFAPIAALVEAGHARPSDVLVGIREALAKGARWRTWKPFSGFAKAAASDRAARERLTVQAGERWRKLEAQSRELVAGSPAATDPDFTPILKLLVEGAVSPGAVLKGVRYAIRIGVKPDTWRVFPRHIQNAEKLLAGDRKLRHEIQVARSGKMFRPGPKWWRLGFGAPDDPVWTSIAKAAGVSSPAVAFAIGAALQERGSEDANNRGRLDLPGVKIAARLWGFEEAAVERVATAMRGLGFIAGERLVDQPAPKRQPPKDPSAAERQRRSRANRRRRAVTAQASLGALPAMEPIEAGVRAPGPGDGFGAIEETLGHAREPRVARDTVTVDLRPRAREDDSPSRRSVESDARERARGPTDDDFVEIEGADDHRRRRKSDRGSLIARRAFRQLRLRLWRCSPTDCAHAKARAPPREA
jgi:hypothetical protein